MFPHSRFFFTHCASEFLPLAFTLQQRTALSKRTLRDILCDNTDIPAAQENVFLNNYETASLSCTERSPLDLELFVM